MKSLYERFDDARRAAPIEDCCPDNAALTRAAWEWFSDRLAQPDVADAFKQAWLEADAQGSVGSRVTAGLQAVAAQVRKP